MAGETICTPMPKHTAKRVDGGGGGGEREGEMGTAVH
jgi:hypothetical protein